MATKTSVRAHSYRHFKDLQLQPKIFYDLVEDLIVEFEYPGVSTKRMKLSENGIFSAGKEYLCIKRHNYVYNVCATPFGKSFMISWWIKREGNGAGLIARLPFARKFFAKKAQSRTHHQLDMEMLFMQSIDALIKEAVHQIQTDNNIVMPETMMALNNN